MHHAHALPLRAIADDVCVAPQLTPAAMAEAARAGATADEGCTARLLHAAQAGAPDVLAADGYLFATPENLAA